MSTHALVLFCNRDVHEARAGVYVHFDGYPEGPQGMLEEFKEFFEWVHREHKKRKSPFDSGAQFNPDSTCAEYVAWKVLVKKTGRGLGVVADVAGDHGHSHTYYVVFDGSPFNTPQVRHTLGATNVLPKESP